MSVLYFFLYLINIIVIFIYLYIYFCLLIFLSLSYHYYSILGWLINIYFQKELESEKESTGTKKGKEEKGNKLNDKN